MPVSDDAELLNGADGYLCKLASLLLDSHGVVLLKLESGQLQVIHEAKPTTYMTNLKATAWWQKLLARLHDHSQAGICV